FNKLTDTQSLANKETLDTIAKQVLALSTDIHIEVQGYANNVSNTEEENINELIPLSQNRADAIKAELVKRGLKESNLTAVGKGGENPLAKWEDKEHWWKNRRVEFVVTK
nr:OmpA family protein [Treponema sp.]